MRTLSLAIAVSVCLGTSAAHAVCTTGVECIRERFGVDQTVRNNRLIDRTDRLGDRGRPLNPYVAGQNAANQARRAGRFDSTTLDSTASRRSAVDPLQPGEIRPDVRYTPGTAIDPYTPGALNPGGTQDAPAPTVEPYAPALPATGELGAAGPQEQALPRSRTARPAAPAQRDQNRPQGAADLRYGGPKTSGAYR
jgi:hypothetical protein